MSALGVLLRKELHATFTSPIAYAVGTVFLLVTGYTFSLTLFLSKVANLTYIFHQMYVLLVLLVPVLTMRAFAEERRADTLELLLTAPVREVWIVLAKFLAALALIAGLLVLSGTYAVVLGLYGEPDWAPIYGGYLALVLLACLLIALGMLTSSLTENQVVAATTALGISLMLWFADWSPERPGVCRCPRRPAVPVCGRSPPPRGSGWLAALVYAGGCYAGGRGADPPCQHRPVSP